MPLTPADVHNVAFSKPPIGKRGYNEDEVDAFLDLVENELTRLIEENDDLRQQVSQLEQRLGNVQADLEDARSRPPAPRWGRSRRPRSRSGRSSRRRCSARWSRSARWPRRHRRWPSPPSRPATTTSRWRRCSAWRRRWPSGSPPRPSPRPTRCSPTPAPRPSSCCPRRAPSPTGSSTTRGPRAETMLNDARTRAETLERQSRDKAAKLVGDAERQQSEIIGSITARQVGAREEDRRAPHVRARVPHPAQDLPRVAAAGPGRTWFRRAVRQPGGRGGLRGQRVRSARRHR